MFCTGSRILLKIEKCWGGGDFIFGKYSDYILDEIIILIEFFYEVPI
jgi:hypothetical protein